MIIKDGPKCLAAAAVVVSVISYDVVFQHLNRSPTYVADERFHAFFSLFLSTLQHDGAVG